MKNLKRNFYLIGALGFLIIQIVSWIYENHTSLIFGVTGFYGSLILQAIEEIKEK